MTTAARQATLPLVSLRHHPGNPAGRHTGADVDELADSIRVIGILQPLLVEPAPDGAGYVVLAGNRRLAAARAAGLWEAPCVIRDAGDDGSHTAIRLIENGHRKGLTPMQQARAFAELRDRDGLTQTEVARRTGFSLSHVSLRLMLLQLDAGTQARIEAGELSAENAVAAIREARGTAGSKKQQKKPSTGRNCYFGPSHPVAEAARQMCRSQHGEAGRTTTGGVACAPCWEAAIRADERWVIETGDAPAEDGATEVLDDIAIERAIRGDQVRLTPAERAEAARRMLAAGLTATTVGHRLNASASWVAEVLEKAS